ncbi:hypothetical protein GWK47_037834 [Chionoecetes opilio]|uniref:Uncharacterized protein n=1 Tax=Chionoecetes opilio TaxID=41210 RepID=A0A8J5CYJ2_CHIOP|nr:hypothetical protein GWK47_037834 [Chionoecetes opilio]
MTWGGAVRGGVLGAIGEQGVTGWTHTHALIDSLVGSEDWEELEALLEAEHLILGQQQQQADVNLLHSPEHPPHLPPEAPPSRSSSRRSLPRTRGGFSVPLHQLSSILLNMTFSDAEDEHPTAGRNTSNEQERSLSRSRTESGVSNASTVSLASPSSSAGRAATSNGPGPATLGGARGEDIVAAAQNATVADMTGVDKKKIVEKLQQIQGYIQQTTAAMAALEQQGDISKVGQYNTLAKVLRELKDSEAKLKVQADPNSECSRSMCVVTNLHCVAFHVCPSPSTSKGLQSDIYARYVHLNSSLQHQEEEYLDILARSLVLNKAAAQVANGTQQSTAPSSSLATQVNGQDETVAEEGSRVVGVISANNVLTLQDRLSASQDESVSIMGQMRASIARREGLLSRYKVSERL